MDLLVRDPDLPTFTYTKLINVETGVEDKPRVDFINTRRDSGGAERQIAGAPSDVLRQRSM